MKDIHCKICENSSDLKKYNFREMMFGLKEEFIYLECPKCNCLQIAEIPSAMEKYYPSNYYSYANPVSNKKNSISNFLKRKRNSYAVLNEGLIGRLAYRFFPSEQHRSLSEVPLSKDSKILDVGCGNGLLLSELKTLGFNNLLGVDPFIEKDINHNDGFTIKKMSIHDVKEKQDIIMLHHSFEHLSDPLKTLQSVSALLNDGGYCIIRIPTSSSYAWRHYKEDWVQLDAPRHFFIHSQKSMSVLTKKVSLNIERIVYDSTGFQFWGSEQYKKDIPLRNENSYAENPNNSIFSKKQIKEFNDKSKELNRKAEGDQCAFIIKKN